MNIISFLALLTFFNAVLSWLGGMFGCPELSFGVRRQKKPPRRNLFHTYITSVFSDRLLLSVNATGLHDGGVLGRQLPRCRAAWLEDFSEWVCGLSAAGGVHKEAGSRGTAVCGQHKAILVCESRSSFQHNSFFSFQIHQDKVNYLIICHWVSKSSEGLWFFYSWSYCDFFFPIMMKLKVHAETIVTYALCGFTNFASLGTAMGAMSKCRT